MKVSFLKINSFLFFFKKMTYIEKNKNKRNIQQIINYRIGITPLLTYTIIKEIQSEYQINKNNNNNN